MAKREQKLHELLKEWAIHIGYLEVATQKLRAAGLHTYRIKQLLAIRRKLEAFAAKAEKSQLNTSYQELLTEEVSEALDDQELGVWSVDAFLEMVGETGTGEFVQLLGKLEALRLSVIELVQGD